MRKSSPDDDDEAVAFHAHYAHGEDASVAVHVRGAPSHLDEDSEAVTARGATYDLDDANTIPKGRDPANDEIDLFVTMLDIAHRERVSRDTDIETTSRRVA